MKLGGRIIEGNHDANGSCANSSGASDIKEPLGSDVFGYEERIVSDFRVDLAMEQGAHPLSPLNMIPAFLRICHILEIHTDVILC